LSAQHTLSDRDRPKSKVVELLSELSIGARFTIESQKYEDLSAVKDATKRWRWLPHTIFGSTIHPIVQNSKTKLWSASRAID
jgi:hypothetical protein